MADVKILEPVLLSALTGQGIAADNVELWRDYAPRSRGQGYSPYARCYRDAMSEKHFSVISALPMVDAYGQAYELAWSDKTGKFENGNNIFHSIIDKGDLHLLALSDQPTGTKINDDVNFHPQLFIGGAEILPLSDTPKLISDPLNKNYAYNTLEWDYGVCLRRVRLIEGCFLGSWLFVTNPKGDVLIKYNQSGKLKLQLQYAKDGDTEYIPKAFFDEAKDYPVTISDSATFYPDADPETSSVDGYCYALVGSAGEAWSSLIAEAGGGAIDSESLIKWVYILGGSTTNYFRALYRGVILFDTSALTASASISAATLSIYGIDKTDNLSCTPDINIYSSAPASNTALVAGDFDSLGSTAFCNTPITYANWGLGYKDFALNAAGIAAISKTAVSKFGTRNANYDVAASQPPWISGVESYLRGYAAEKGTGYQPKLVVTYTTGVTEKSSSETGAGAEAKTSGYPVVVIVGTEIGSGLESLGGRDLARAETGSGFDIASLLAALMGNEAGSGAEAALKIAAFISGDAGLGSELSWMQKEALSGDNGGGYDALKTLKKTADSSSDMRLSGRAGQVGMPSRQVRMPSKGVNL